MHVAYLAASSPPADALPALRVRAAALRDLLLADARSLARRGRLEGAALRGLRRRQGYLEIASELGVLVRVLRDRWAELKGRCAIDAAELAEAEQLLERLTVAHAGHSKAARVPRQVTEDRLRAWTVLVRAYGAVRRAAAYLEAEDAAPSLWAGPGMRRPRRPLDRPRPAPAG